MKTTLIPKLAVFVIASALLCGAQAKGQHPGKPELAAKAAEPSGPVTPQPFEQRNPRYELRAGDVMDLNFDFSPEFNQSVTVQPDGFISLRGIGDVHVAGQSVPEVTATIKTAYSKILKAPSLSIVLKDFEKPYFIAAGDVARPGKYELRGRTTLTEAVAIAGGFDENAKHSRVVLYRKVSGDWMEGKLVDVKKMMASRNLSEDLQIHPGDMIYVPRSVFSRFKRFIPSPGVGIGAPIP